MRNSVEIPYNEKYHKTPFYPRQRRKLRRLEREMRKRGIEPKLTGIEIAGDENMKVIGHVADQIHTKIGDVMDRRFVLCFGDGGNIIFNSALVQNLGDADLENELVVADGGTMANLSHALNTADPAVAAGVVSGDIRSQIRNLRLREAKIMIFNNGETPSKEYTYPWTNSVGTHIAGDLLSGWERHPRSRNPFMNLALSIGSVFMDTVGKHGKGQPIRGVSAFTSKHVGFFEFDDKFTDLEGDSFHYHSFESKFGLEALKRILVFAAIGHSKALSRRAWSDLPEEDNVVTRSDFYKIAKDVKPREVTHLTLIANDVYPNIHLDGYPVNLKDLGMEDGGYAEIELSSTDKSIPVAQALN